MYSTMSEPRVASRNGGWFGQSLKMEKPAVLSGGLIGGFLFWLIAD
jgi:hypothetical protein